MNPRWDESEFVFGDLQIAAQFIHHDNPFAARLFLEAAYDTFAFRARNPGVGRQRADLGFPEIRSRCVDGFGRYLIFTANCRVGFKSGGSCMAHAICIKFSANDDLARSPKSGSAYSRETRLVQTRPSHLTNY